MKNTNCCTMNKEEERKFRRLSLLKCSKCGGTAYGEYPNYCQNCGRKNRNGSHYVRELDEPEESFYAEEAYDPVLRFIYQYVDNDPKTKEDKKQEEIQ